MFLSCLESLILRIRTQILPMAAGALGNHVTSVPAACHAAGSPATPPVFPPLTALASGCLGVRSSRRPNPRLHLPCHQSIPLHPSVVRVTVPFSDYEAPCCTLRVWGRAWHGVALGTFLSTQIDAYRSLCPSHGVCESKTGSGEAVRTLNCPVRFRD